MLGFASFGELTFGGLGSTGAVIIVTGSAVTISQGPLLLMVKLLLMLQETLLL